MVTRMLNLNSIDNVKEFVNIVSKFDLDMDLGSGRHIIYAKSIMGIFRLDLSKPVEFTVHNNENECVELLAAIEKFIVQQEVVVNENY